MNWLETLRTSFEAIRAHRLRSGLTMLGILIGIAAVILTVGLGQGAQAQVASAINSLGTNLLVVSPGSATTSTGVRGGSGSATTLTVHDATALAAPGVAPDIAGVAPTTTRSTSLAAGATTWTTSVVGTTPPWLRVRAKTLDQGRFLTEADETGEAAVVVLGPTTASELFGSTNAVGRTVTIGSTPFTVIGVLASAGTSSALNEDDQAVVPISTAADRLTGGANRTSVQAIYLEATTPDTLSAAYQEANQELLVLHHLASAASADFTINSQQSLLNTASSVSRTLTLLLGGVAAISLLVGGIGVMNIMLVSVTERIREIGLRKAVGASPVAIRRQFMVEASVLGLAGGLLGALLGIAGALVLPHLIAIPITISPVAALVAILTAIAIGLVFGVYPAGRAARLAPIDALRSE
ncbi:FtsX-like permease family protein [Amycolatopsis rhizosphaerae]|uniref:FtsX-like permease family protein n=1 Tax=Amycolatopsis rhizosphaerae TaxID=2053003 RepID=A0A558BIZ0_9PSEU|nr:ABC transporter permease [Amycolatopsis rhizosphaerae]TVT36461.1 FtsX-like permease family protein [Amycolatopsis rhizosphaerae]